jgi:Mce-associated membrane protein
VTAKESEAVADEIDGDEVGDEIAEDHAAAGIESDVRSGPATYGVRRWACWVAGGMLVVLTGAAATLGALVFQQHQQDGRMAQALDAARSYAVTLTTTDQNTIDKNFAEVTAGATGEFKDAYSKAWSQMRKMLIDNKVTTTGTVIDAAAKAPHGDDVGVLLSVKQVIASAASPDPRTDFVSMSVTMRKVGGKWLAAQVSLAGADGKRAK